MAPEARFPRIALCTVHLPGRELRIDRELVTDRRVYSVNDLEVSLNEYLTAVCAFMDRDGIRRVDE